MPPIHKIQRLLLELSQRTDLATLKLREMADQIGMPGVSPQLVRHHLMQLVRRRLLTVSNDQRWTTTSVASTDDVGALGTSKLFRVPILGAANCGPASLFAEENLEGFLRVSPRLVKRDSADGLFALRASGSSMDRAVIDGRTIEDGDLVIVDSKQVTPKTGDVVVAILSNRASIKRFVNDPANHQVVLRSESSRDFEPIHLHEEDEFRVSGRVVAVIKQPRVEDVVD